MTQPSTTQALSRPPIAVVVQQHAEESAMLRHQRSVVQDDNPAIRGMIFQVRHLVRVENAEGQETNG